MTNAPDERQREAILKISGLSIAQKQFANAELELGNFLAQFPGSAAADVVLLALGELYLKDYAAQPATATNQLEEAQACFDKFLGSFKNSPLAGKAYLDRGWCKWLSGKKPESFGDLKPPRKNCRRQRIWPSRGSKWATRCSRKKILRAR